MNAYQFKKAGVSTSDMQLQLMNIEKHVKEDIDSTGDKSERVVELEEELATNIDKAKQTISMLE